MIKSFKYKAKLLGNTEADGANGILQNSKIVVPLICLSKFWRSLEINSKVELEFRWTNDHILSAAE